MTGPSHGAGPDKTVLVREGHCEPEVTVTTVYHLSLLPQWPSEEDPLLKKSATVTSITSSTSGQSKRGAATSSLFQSSFKISSPKGLVPSPPAYSNTYSFHFGSAAQIGPGPKVPSRRQSRRHESFSSFSSSVASGSSLVGTTPQFPSQLQPLPPVLHPLSGLSVSTGSQALPTSEVVLTPLEVRG
nr:hypothetical protein BgiMline_002424 [Biomphalaria glabrata]